MIPAEHSITIYRGDSVALGLRIRELLAGGAVGDYINLTGATARAQIRLTEDSNQILASWTVAIADQITNTGLINLSLSPAQTSALPTNIPCRWDIEVAYPDGSVVTYLKGTVSIMPDVTR